MAETCAALVVLISKVALSPLPAPQASLHSPDGSAPIEASLFLTIRPAAYSPEAQSAKGKVGQQAGAKPRRKKIEGSLGSFSGFAVGLITSFRGDCLA